MDSKGWIPVTERLPEEHDSIFAKYYGTDRWDEYMYRKVSDNVLVTVMYPTSGTKCVINSHTEDGQWRCGVLYSIYGAKITAWMPLPEPYVG